EYLQAGDILRPQIHSKSTKRKMNTEACHEACNRLRHTSEEAWAKVSISSLPSFQDALEFFHFLRGQPLAFDEMGKHGTQGSAEDAFQEGVTHRRHAIGFPDAGMIQIGPPPFLKAERALLNQPVQQCFYRFGMPVLLAGNL